nr:hypothetical protein [Tanacetum cinerariifolium]
MRTRRSVRTSPLAYDPEVERSARLRRKAVRQFSTNLDFAGLKELFTEMSENNATGAESPPRGVDSYYRPGNLEDPSTIVYPAAANGDSSESLDFEVLIVGYEHVVMNCGSAGNMYLHSLLMFPAIKQLAIKWWDEYGFVIHPGLVGVTCKSVRIDL